MRPIHIFGNILIQKKMFQRMEFINLREKAELHVKIGRCDSQLYPLILLNTSFLNGIVVNRTLFYWGVFWNKAYRLSLCSISVALSLRDVFRNLSKGGGLKFFLFPGRGTQHPLGPKNILKAIDFTGPGGGLSPHSPPEYA